MCMHVCTLCQCIPVGALDMPNTHTHSPLNNRMTLRAPLVVYGTRQPTWLLPAWHGQGWGRAERWLPARCHERPAGHTHTHTRD